MLNPDYQYDTEVPKADTDSVFGRTNLHQHSFFELVYVRQGNMYQNIENRIHLYSEGSFCLMNQNIHHAELFSTDYEAVFFALPQQIIEDLFSDERNQYFASEKDPDLDEIRSFFQNNGEENKKALREYIDFVLKPEALKEKAAMISRFEALLRYFLISSPGRTFHIKGTLMEIFTAIVDKNSYDNIPINVGTEQEAKIFDRISDIMKTTHGRASRSDLSCALKYDGSYLNDIVKKYSGLNIFGYGTLYTMREAVSLLTHTELSIEEIMSELDFSNRTHFYKIFREYYGTTPCKYRCMLKSASRVFD
ncbi:helix-turn-helix domain-containing protein [Lachnoclostridium sp. Marseille-P6806]|uniref:helix-turn-helix domain-containing protein n=1 Tax=Lachnoclostridium sp. Marseille-P6806 TaxID=2364793 RepID=UPI0013EF23C9|nr:helix-turn-helix transcriptional regulator [Lachnoclostridium sp. Marseille-P6806]